MKYHTFLPKFHDLIRQRSKQTTIRGRTLVKPGETFALRHWTGKAYRSPMGILGTATCQSLHRFTFCGDGMLMAGMEPAAGWWAVKGPDAERVAVRDGFASLEAMREHFLAAGHVLPFSGLLITWGDTFKPSATP